MAKKWTRVLSFILVFAMCFSLVLRHPVKAELNDSTAGKSRVTAFQSNEEEDTEEEAEPDDDEDTAGDDDTGGFEGMGGGEVIHGGEEDTGSDEEEPEEEEPAGEEPEEPADEEPEDTEPGDAEPEDTEPEDAEPEDEEPEDEDTEDEEPEDEEPEDEEPEDEEPEDEEPEDEEPEDEDSEDEEPEDEEPEDEEPEDEDTEDEEPEDEDTEDEDLEDEEPEDEEPEDEEPEDEDSEDEDSEDEDTEDEDEDDEDFDGEEVEQEFSRPEDHDADEDLDGEDLDDEDLDDEDWDDEDWDEDWDDEEETEEQFLAPVQGDLKTVGSIITFGQCEQNNDTINGRERIEWIVLDVQEGGTLLISRYALAQQPYNKKGEDVTWETCSLRKWLNSEFMKAAFNQRQQNLILQANVDNSSSQGSDKWMTSGGNNTKDYVFLLSYAEVKKYLKTETDRSCELTAFAQSQASGEADALFWWLRSPGSKQENAMDVDLSGKRHNNKVSSKNGFIRPALWISNNGY